MIENNPISSMSTKSTDQLQSVEKKTRPVETQQVEKNRDKAEVSENAKLLAKAASALNDSSPVENSRVQEITKQVQEGTYTVPVSKLASVLAERLSANK